METKRFRPREIRDMRVQETIAKAMAGLLTWKEVEYVLCCSARHVRRLRAKCVLEGIESLRDKRANRAMPRRIPDSIIREVMHLRQTRYFDFNIKHFQEKLCEQHQISVGYTYLKRLLQTTGLAEIAPARGKHRRRRERRPRRGMMLHMDASTHAWLGAKYGKRDLIYVLDDATSEVLYASLIPQENTRGCLIALQHVLQAHGLFSEMYTDRGSHFGCTKKAGSEINTENVQFARVLRGLKIQAIYAHSPQARGRSERAFRTVQGRLPQELRDANITTWEQANQYLNQIFMTDFNRKFAIQPLESQNAFIPLVGVDLGRACALEHHAIVYADNTVRWRKRILQIQAHPTRPSFAKCKVLIVEYLNGVIEIEYGPTTIARFDNSKHSLQGEFIQGLCAYA